MALRQTADHEQTHAAGDGDVHGGRRGEPLVDRREVLGGQTDTGVVDLDQHAPVGQGVTGDLDLGLRGGERGRVLQQLGEQVHEVVDDAAGHFGGRHRGQFDALVLLHLGGGGAEHVDQGDRAGPPAAGLLTREDEEVLTVTAHAGREVVQLEQRGQLVRVGLAGLQLGDQRQLALDQTLGTAREVGEHRVDVAPQQGLLGGEADRLAVHVVERRGHTADLVPGVHTDRLHGRVDVLRVGLGELLDQVGQALLGDLGRGLLQAAQRPDHGPGHDEGADEGHTEHEEDQRTGDERVALGGAAQLTGLLFHLLEQRELDVLHLLDLGGAVVQPVTVGARAHRLQTELGGQRAAGVLVGRLDRGVALFDGQQQLGGGVLAVDALEGADLGLLALEGRLRVEPVVLVELALGGVAGGQRGGQDGALDRRVLLGGGEGRQGTRALDHVGVAGRLRHVLREVDQVLDQAVVALDGLRRVVLLLERRVADLGELAQVAGQLDEVVADALEVAVLARRVDLLGTVEEVRHGAVGLLAVALDREVRALAAVRERTGRLVTLLLEGVRQLGGLLGHLRQQLHVVELLDVVHRLLDTQRAERGGRDHRQRQQRHQAGRDPPVAQGYSRTRAGRTGGGDRRSGGCGRRARTGALAAAASGRGRSLALGVLGRGADGLGASPALRLRLRRSAAIPLETSLH
ncbi:hypothetical protein SALBM217S_00253 [Streptomyces griseoloalbus]